MICFITKEYQNYIFFKIALSFFIKKNCLKMFVNLNMRQMEFKFAKTYKRDGDTRTIFT